MAEKLSNIIGAPFSNYILEQLYTRAARNSTVQRSNEEVLFLANKTAWARLISSVNITTGDSANTKPLSKFYETLGLGSTYTKPEDLAKNWILEAGTSKANGQGITLREGIGPDGAYGLGGTEELGYRPMPGLTSVQIDTVGRLGSLRQATISFKVWNMNQLNIVEALYFRLGYSMLLEWGHTQFFTNSTLTNPGGTFTTATNTFGLDDPFATGTDKMTVQQRIAKKSRDMSGNYDGMLGIVSNFDWSFNQQGGYDCTVKLIGLGSIIDTMRINQSYKMPPGLVKQFRQAQQSIQDEENRRAQKQAEEQRQNEIKAAAERQKQEEANKSKIPQNFDELYQLAVKYGYQGDAAEFRRETGFYQAFALDSTNSVPDFYYQIPGQDAINEQSLGLFVRRGNRTWIRVPKKLGGPGVGTPFIIDVQLLEEIFRRDNAKEDYRGRRDRIAAAVSTTQVAKNFEVDAPTVTGAEVANMVTLQYTAYVFDGREKDFNITFDLRYVGTAPTRAEVLTGIDLWLDTATNPNAGLLYLTEMKPDISIFRDRELDDLIIDGRTQEFQTGAAKFWFTVEFDNTGLIKSVGAPAPPPNPPAPTAEPQTPATGDTAATENTSTPVQTEAASGYESALHVMLSYVKTVSLQQAILAANSTKPVISVDLTSATKSFYQDGILKDVFNPVPTADIVTTTPFNVTYYAQKGFNSNLMSDALVNPGLYGQIPSVDFTKLSTAYLVQYRLSNQVTDTIEYPTYITLGYLLAFLNNMCLIYDSKQKIGSNNAPQGSDKTPYVYIDFNPETNFCLTSPQHLSIDPMVCLIPYQGGDEAYKQIFPTDVVSSVTGLFAPKAEDSLSGQIPEFKALAGNPYQGKTMNILLNIDFLLKVADSFATSDSNHAVNLQGFLESILTEVNKSLGNINLFRVAYRDESNTVQIKDDQWVPGASGEITILNRTAPVLPGTGMRLGELPVFGLQSLARSFQFKTNVSTKLGSMIAISAQAATGSVNATDPSSFSYLNAPYQDRFKPYITEASGVATAGSAAAKAIKPTTTDNQNNDIVVADQFNTVVKSVYFDFNLDIGKTDAAKNYYIERLSKVKSADAVTSAAPFIPADLEITLDGIAGILMGNAFTIPEDRLPLSLRGEPGRPKVGFVVAGLTHTIQNNQWLTKIRGQMIKLRDVGSYKAVEEVNKIQRSLTRVSNTDTGVSSGTGTVLTASGCRTSYPQLPIIPTVQVETYSIEAAAKYLKSKYPDIGKAAFAIIVAEAAKAGDNFRSAGGNNFGGIQTDSGVWGFGTFNGQFCRRDNSGRLRMFASFPSPESFLDFLVDRLKAKGFANTTGVQWTKLYIDRWWSPAEKARYTEGTAIFKAKLSIFNSAAKRYDLA